MSTQKQTVYLKLNQITEVRNQDVYLKDVAEIYCSEKSVENRCMAMKIKRVSENKKKRYVCSALEVIQKLEESDSRIQVTNVGEVDYIIDYKPPQPDRRLWEWCKTLFVCAVCFCGAAFAIITFNNDVNTGDVFKEIYRLVMGVESDGYTVLEFTYSVGLAAGILIFFNHFAAWKVSADPTPLEVEMRLYEDNISKTLIQNDSRKESDIDVT